MKTNDYVLVYNLCKGGYWIVKSNENCLLLLEHIQKNGVFID